MRCKLTHLALSGAAALILSGATASAGLVINTPVISGPEATVSGSGALPNGHVELFVNNVSQGSGAADGSGNFSFSGLTVDEDDALVVRQSRVWNFNEDGNLEGWTSANANATVSVSGGDLIVTAVATGNVSVTPGTGLALDPSVYRVWEMKIRNPTTLNNYTFRWRGTNGFDGTNAQGFVGMPSATGTDYEIVRYNPDYNFGGSQTTYQTQPGGEINSVRLDFSLVQDDVLYIDYIRVTENWEYRFDNPGDTEMLTFTRLGTPTVADGKLSFTLADENPVIEKGSAPPDKSLLDASHFTRAEVRGSYLDSAEEFNPDRWQLYFNAGSGFAGNNTAMNLLGESTIGLPTDGTVFTAEADMAAHANFPASGALSAIRLDPATFHDNAGDQGTIEYFLLGPANAYGPSEPVSVVGPNEIKITEPVQASPSADVGGTGAPANGWVELFAGNVSLGSVQADGSGDFLFEDVAITEGQDLVVAASRVWNFNTDGDTEGWLSQNTGIATLQAIDGALQITKVDDGTADIRTGTGLNIDPSVYRVWEFRINNPTSQNAFNFRFRGTNAFDATNVLGNVSMKPGMASGAFETVKLNPDYNFNNELTTYQSEDGGLIQDIRLDFNHANGETISIDSIRVTEYFEYSFRNDGDAEYLDLSNARGTPVVADGTMSWTLNAPSPNLVKVPVAPDKTRIDPSHFTHVAVGGSMLDSGSTTDQWTMYVNPDGAGFAGNIIQLPGLPTDGSYFTARREIAEAAPAYAASPPTVAWRLDPGTFNMDDGDDVSIDYWRLEPLDPFGPSAAVTVEPGDSSVEDWFLF